MRTHMKTHTHSQSVLADPNSGIGKGSKKKKGGGGSYTIVKSAFTVQYICIYCILIGFTAQY